MPTIRQHIIDLLTQREMNATELSQDLGIREKEVYEHLPHISRSVAAQGKMLVILPSQCLSCGYVFEERKRFTRPSRCARCRGTHLQRPAYVISETEKGRRGKSQQRGRKTEANAFPLKINDWVSEENIN